MTGNLNAKAGGSQQTTGAETGKAAADEALGPPANSTICDTKTLSI